MDNITIGQITATITCVVAFLGGVKYLLESMKKIIDKALKPTNDKIDIIEKKLTEEMKRIDINATKNFLVSHIHEIKNDTDLDGITKQRIYEQYEHYQKLGGNSYISSEIERLRKEGAL